MELEIVNKLFLELSQFATAKTERELKLEAEALSESKANVLHVLMHDEEKGWAEISSGLTQDFVSGTHSFNVRFNDGTEHCISFKVEEI